MGVSVAGVADLRAATTPREIHGSKRTNGSILVISGSSDFHGSAALSSNAAYNTLAALRVGIGYAYLYVPKSILDPVRRLSPDLIVKPFGASNIGEGKFSDIRKSIDRSNAVVMGMGVGRSAGAMSMCSRIIDYALGAGKKVVIDADAIYSLGRKRPGYDAIVTPQDREFEQLSGVMPPAKPAERIDAASALARRLRCTVLLKGHETIITDGKRVKVVKSESSSLAVMGTGDVLSGIIGGYAAAGAEIFKAGVAGAYLHSRIGDMLNRKMGGHILASDVVAQIPYALRKFDTSK